MKPITYEFIAPVLRVRLIREYLKSAAWAGVRIQWREYRDRWLTWRFIVMGDPPELQIVQARVESILAPRP